ncbi:hypothetical protein BZH87_22930 [Salmonella enterica]|nr:hypothetical protein [Salmonella enterica]ECH9067167.1 hypothetical protein [Salmonella enterica subsp. enterica]EAM3112745.1 hypothetical protein [Salmonella enterica]EAM3233309.1 hypothetical protein [Salmonella enterica]EAM4664412.1 hypothetical protein [Salmonella enterica]
MRVKSILIVIQGFFLLPAHAAELPSQVQGVEVGELTCACEMSQESKLITGEKLLNKVSMACHIDNKQAIKMVKMLSLVPLKLLY